MAIEQFIPDRKEEEETELIVLWKDLTAYFKHLSLAEKKAMFLRTAPRILGIYNEFDYRFDGLDDVKRMIKSLED